MSQAGEAVVNGLPYIQAFRSFDQVVSKCFGVSLKEGYKEAIEDFKTAYMNLGITVTPKVYCFRYLHFFRYQFQVHIVFQHINEFLSQVNSSEESTNFGNLQKLDINII